MDCLRGFRREHLSKRDRLMKLWLSWKRTFVGRARQVSQARSSVGERFLDTEEVGSSILPVPTIFQ